jgi:hypothetical protein
MPHQASSGMPMSSMLDCRRRRIAASGSAKNAAATASMVRSNQSG